MSTENPAAAKGGRRVSSATPAERSAAARRLKKLPARPPGLILHIGEPAGEAPAGAVARFEAQHLQRHWCARGFFGQADEGRLTVLQITVWPSEDRPSQEVNVTLLREVSTLELIAAAQSKASRDAEWQKIRRARGWPTAGPEQTASLERLAGVVEGDHVKKGGRPGLGDDHFEHIARRYLELQAEHGSYGLLKRLAETEGRPRDTVRDWVHQARVRGFLTPGRAGVAGAGPGPRLLTHDEGDE